ncbi:hypothetical protein [Blastomonas sp. CCH1-A6]|uniref:hypothetical protein n=1 Tax=Blastomonas sp. CCH1-A6 TaxID=1768762 RepID=UPI0008322AAF|tara:strand:+ start:32061 stop:32339 length:279 start_codon:yes stop_codon:yes gene_type:complete
MTSNIDAARDELALHINADRQLAAQINHLNDRLANVQIEPDKSRWIFGMSRAAYLWLVVLTAFVAALMAYLAIDFVVSKRFDARLTALEAAQ